MPSSVSARKAPNAYHHGDLREALIEAAERVVQDEGAEAVGFSALAKLVGVSQAAPYRHFKDREALLAAVAARAFRSLTGALQEAVARSTGGSPLSRLAHAYVDFGLCRVGMYRMMFASRLLERAAVGSELHLAVSESYSVLLGTLGGAEDETARSRTALKLLAALHGLVTLTEQGILPPKAQPVSVEALVDDVVRDAERAIGAPSPEARSTEQL